MTLLNVRFGYATNSSSTHSMVIIPDNLPMPITDEYDGFGWDFFTAADKRSKENYALFLIENTVKKCIISSGIVGYENCDSITNLLVKTWFGSCTADYCEDPTDKEQSSVYVDHQSVFHLPANWKQTNIDVEFAKAFMDELVNSRIAILGGNDNTEQIHHLDGIGNVAKLPSKASSGMVMRYDNMFNYWTGFNRETGTKVRFRMNNDETVVEKSSFPELVDMKITDYCPFACDFCYMDSTSTGAHASMDHISSIILELAEKKVFEIAFGGGEPTLHPKFREILTQARLQHIVPNFTTKNLAWLRDPIKFIPILELCGAFAYSVESSEDVVQFANLLDEASKYKIIKYGKAIVQVIPEILTELELRNILSIASERKIPVTLLGYKMVGRGGSYADKRTNTSWINVVNEMRLDGEKIPAIGIDTILAQTTDLNGIDHRLYTLHEGKFSMYVDAVSLTVASSSFSEDHIILPNKKTNNGAVILDNTAYDYVTKRYNADKKMWKDVMWGAFSSF